MEGKKKAKRVTRGFLLGLANTIHSSRDRTFLNLCRGTLQNGPDPVDGKRTMHCGLGELYFAITGRQPDQDGVSESDVVNLAVQQSPLGGTALKARDAAMEALDSLPEALRRAALRELEELETEEGDDDYVSPFASEAEVKFRKALDAIPTENDRDGCSEERCTVATYKDRSKRVAAKLREAARALPSG